jgi:hypothetical protein
MTIVARITAALPALKADFLKVETYVKTVVVAAATGAAADVAQLLHGGHEILFTPAGILLLKHSFLYGAACSVIGLFTRSPLTSQPPK